MLSFLVGLRFDIASVMIVGGIFFLLFLLPFSFAKQPLYKKIVFSLFAVFLLASLLVFASDLFYYQFVGRRFSFEVFTFLKNTSDVSAMIAKAYKVELVVFTLFLALVYFLFRKLIRKFMNEESGITIEESKRKIFLKEISVFIFAIFVIIISIRGGFQLKPLRDSYAFRNDNLPLGQIGRAHV